MGEEPVITRDREMILAADKVILPGVGAFGDAMEKLRQYGLEDVIRQVADRGRRFSASAWGCSFCLRAARRVPAWPGWDC